MRNILGTDSVDLTGFVMKPTSNEQSLMRDLACAAVGDCGYIILHTCLTID